MKAFFTIRQQENSAEAELDLQRHTQHGPAMPEGEISFASTWAVFENTPLKDFEDVGSFKSEYNVITTVSYGRNLCQTLIDKGDVRRTYISQEGELKQSDLLPVLQVKYLRSGTKNYNIVGNLEKIPIGLIPVVQRLKKFAELKQNWDSYGAKPIEWSTISRAIDFFSKVLFQNILESKNNLPIPFVAPLSDGGIQFEWRNCFKELVIVLPNRQEKGVVYLKVEHQLFGEKEEEGKLFNTDEAVPLILEWLIASESYQAC